MSQLQYTVQFPVPGASDVTNGGQREFHLLVNGADANLPALDGAAMQTQFIVNDGDAYEFWLVDIDKSKNRSPESDHISDTAKDTFAPPKPGALGVVNVIQLPDAPQASDPQANAPADPVPGDASSGDASST
jgi:hypothetical protein